MASRRVDQLILVVVFLLLGIGIVQVYSSSYIYATEVRGDGLFYFKRQLIFALGGMLALMASAWTPWSWWKNLGPWMWGLASLGILATFVPGLGVQAGGATRWLRAPGGFHLEPSELLKVSLPLYLSWALSRTTSKGKWIAFVGWALPLVVLLKQPDFGSFVICMLVSFCILIAQGLSWRWVLAAIVVAIPLFQKLVMEVPYRRARVVAFLDPWSDPGSKGFQVIQSMLSFHSGGLTGTGLGAGQGKLFFLPESHTDFTLAVLGEELGFMGFVVVMSLFAYLIFRGFQVAYLSQQPERRTTSLGLVIVLALAVIINAGVALGLFPTKGLAMPFMSYGGSSLVATCLAVGIILSIHRENQLNSKPSYQKIFR